MENSYYFGGDQGGYYEEYYEPTQGGYYFDNCSNYPYPMHNYYTDGTVETCVGMVDEPEKDCFGTTLHSLERLEDATNLLENSMKDLSKNMSKLVMLQDSRGRSLVEEEAANKRAADLKLQEEKQERMDDPGEILKKALEELSKNLNEFVKLQNSKKGPIVEKEEKDEEAAESPHSSDEFNQDESKEPSYSSSSDTMTLPSHEDEEDETNKTVVNSFKPSLSIILIPFTADKTEFDEDLQLSHAWRKRRSKAENSKFKLRSCLKYLRYKFCRFILMSILSNHVSAQSSSASHDKLRRAWVRYKVPY